MRTSGLLKRRTQFFSRCGKIPRLMHIASCRRDGRIPPGPCTRPPPPLRNMQKHAMSWRKRKHPFQKRYRLRDAAKKEISGDGVLRKALGHYARSEQRTNL